MWIFIYRLILQILKYLFMSQFCLKIINMFGLMLAELITYQLVKIFPVVLRHESESWQEGPAESIETCVAVVWVRSVALKTYVARFALAKTYIHLM